MTRFSRMFVLVVLLARPCWSVPLPLPTPISGSNRGASTPPSKYPKDVIGVPQASSHPYAFTIAFKLNTDSEGHSEGGELRDLLIDLPPGLAGDPFAMGRCTRQEFEGFIPQLLAELPGRYPPRQHSRTRHRVGGPIYNMVPPPGVAAQLGFARAGLNALPEISSVLKPRIPNATVCMSPTYGLPLEVTAIEATVWGTPAEPGHDAQRGAKPPKDTGEGHAYVGPHEAFLTLPAECSEAAPYHGRSRFQARPRPLRQAEARTRSTPAATPAAPQGCDVGSVHARRSRRPPRPAARLRPRGLDFELGLPNEGLTNPNGIAETEPGEDRSRHYPRGDRQPVGRDRAAALQSRTVRTKPASANAGLSRIVEARDAGRADSVARRTDRRVGVSGDAARQPFQLAAGAVHRRKGTRTRCADQAGRRGAGRSEHGAVDDDVRWSAAVAVLLLPVRSTRRPPRTVDHTHRRAGRIRPRSRLYPFSNPNVADGTDRELHDRLGRERWRVRRPAKRNCRTPRACRRARSRRWRVRSRRSCSRSLAKTARSISVRSPRPSPRACSGSSRVSRTARMRRSPRRAARSGEGRRRAGAVLPVVS